MPNIVSNFLNDELEGIGKLSDKQFIGIAGFNLYAAVRQGYIRSSSIPFVPLESGSVVADHIIKNPLIIDIEGTVADILDRPTLLEKAYIRALSEIGNINRYLPNWTAQQILKINTIINDTQNTIDKIDDYINSGEQIYDYFNSNNSGKGTAEQFIDLMNGLHDTNQLIKVELPYKVYENMAIVNIQVVHPYEFTSGIEFRLTFMQIQFTQNLYADVSKYYKNPSESIQAQTSGENSKGINKTEDVPVSALYSLSRSLAPAAGGA